MKFFKSLVYFLIFISSFNLSSQDCDNFKESGCLKNLDDFYYYQKIIPNSDCRSYELNGKEQFELKNLLTKSIVSFIETQSNLSLSAKKRRDKLSEEEIFNSLSQSNSSAILFNPQFTFCKSSRNSDEINSVFVYVEKSSFDNLAKKYFTNTIKRLNNNLNADLAYFKSDPNYEFEEEIEKYEKGLKTLSSYFGLMVSLNLEQKYFSEFFELETQVNNFSNKINSLENNLRTVDNYVEQSKFDEAYKLLDKIKIKYPRGPGLKDVIENYNKNMSIAKSSKLKELKSKSSSFDDFTIELGFNSALLNTYRGASGTENYNVNEYLDRLFPYIEARFVFNDREKKFGIGPYYRYNFSNTLLVLSPREYFFPFSNSFSEVGIWGQYFFIDDINGDSMASLTFSAGKLLESFISNTGDSLSFWSFSPGLKTYLQKKNSKSYRTSLSFRINLTVAKKQYSYSSFTLGISRNFKVGRKISDTEKTELENEYKTFR